MNNTDDAANHLYISVTHGISGWFAVVYWWNPEDGGFWEPLDTGHGRYPDRADAVAEAKEWAESGEIPTRGLS